jgi:multidrug efflux pump subunit AcrA (membrane-fusion protein)
MTSLIETIARTPADIRRPSFPINYGGQALTGLAIILTAFGGLAAWSATAPLSTAAIAAGTVVVDSNRKTIQHLQGGIVRDILVRDGIRVQEGDVLLRLDPTQSRAMSQMLQGQVDAGRAEEARLLAEREGARALAFPSDLHARARTETSLSELLSGQEHRGSDLDPAQPYRPVERPDQRASVAGIGQAAPDGSGQAGTGRSAQSG